MKAITLAFLAAAALSACASAPSEPVARGVAKYAEDPRLGEETNRICFASGIDGFSMNDRDTVLLHDGKRRYMVEVTGTCFDLDNAESIALDTATGCLTPGDSIIIAQTFGESFGSRRCMIRDIYLWDPKAEAEEPAAEENPA
ncbi:MAG: DUF6491 family protein [Hyphomonas sp.]|jgi:hypothetical protein|nr:DUF6491 family protein [Hyphomonas sp.]